MLSAVALPTFFSLDLCAPYTLFPFSSTCTCCDWTLIQSEEAGCAEFMVFTCRGRELDLFPCLASCCGMQASQFLPLFHHPAKALLPLPGLSYWPFCMVQMCHKNFKRTVEKPLLICVLYPSAIFGSSLGPRGLRSV